MCAPFRSPPPLPNVRPRSVPRRTPAEERLYQLGRSMWFVGFGSLAMIAVLAFIWFLLFVAPTWVAIPLALSLTGLAGWVLTDLFK